MNFKRFFIKKGNHRSGIYPNIYFKMLKTKYEVIFSKDCIYKFNDVDDFDVNKLFGLSFGFHHTNSIRFGWNVDGDKIAIYAYCYKSGERIMNKITSLSTDITNSFEIKVYDDFYELTIYNKISNSTITYITSKPKTVKWGYRLFPYFGGNKTAPHNMEIEMKKIY